MNQLDIFAVALGLIAIFLCFAMAFCTVHIIRGKFNERKAILVKKFIIISLSFTIVLTVFFLLFGGSFLQNKNNDVQASVISNRHSFLEGVLSIQRCSSWWEGNLEYSRTYYGKDSNTIERSKLTINEYDSIVVGENVVVLTRLIYPDSMLDQKVDHGWGFYQVVNKTKNIKVLPHSDQDLCVPGIRKHYKSGDTVDVEVFFNDTNRVWFAIRTDNSKIVPSKYYQKEDIVEKNKDLLQNMLYATDVVVRNKKYNILHPWKL